MKSHPLLRLARAQLKTGTLGFGGPLATMAMMHEELVEREGLVKSDSYFEGLGVVKLLPGPVSSMLSVFLGQEVAGTIGGLVSVFCFVLPSFLMILGLAYLEKKGGQSGWLESAGFRHFLLGMQISVLAIILNTCFKLFRDAQKRPYGGRDRSWAVGAFALLAALLSWRNLPELAVLLFCAAGGVLVFELQERRRRKLAVEPLTIFLSFFMAGLTVWGTGFMVLPALQRLLVENHQWMSQQDFLRGVTYGNLTPGPVVIASTYLGFVLHGLTGSISATAGIFLGPVLLMLLFRPLLKKLLALSWVEGALMGLLPAVAATIALSLRTLAAAVPWALGTLTLFLLSLGALQWRRMPAWGIILGAGLVAIFAI